MNRKWFTCFAWLICSIVLCVSMYDNGFIHWVTAHSSHIFLDCQFSADCFAPYTELRLAGWLLKLPHPPHRYIAYRASVEFRTHIYDKMYWLWSSKKLLDSVMTCITWYSACHVFVCYCCCYDYSQYMLKRKKKITGRGTIAWMLQ